MSKNFNYEPYLCNGCHDFMQKAMNFDDAAFVPAERSDYGIHLWNMSKDDGINIWEKECCNFFIIMYKE